MYQYIWQVPRISDTIAVNLTYSTTAVADRSYSGPSLDSFSSVTTADVHTHSLTHCCAWPDEGRSVLHIERSWPAIQAAPTDRPVSSYNCCSQFLRGRLGGRFQSAAGGVPVWASIDSCSACEAGVFSGRRQMWPNNEWRLSAIRDGISGSFVLSLTTALDTLSYHLIPRIRRSK